MLDQPIEDRQAVGPDDELVMLGAEVPRHCSRMLQLVELRFVEPDRERLHRLGRGFCHQSDDDARVDAAGEECTERNVADHVRAHRIGQDPAQR